jgi:hypothetical protein
VSDAHLIQVASEGGSLTTTHNLDGWTTIKTPDGNVVTVPPK